MINKDLPLTIPRLGQGQVGALGMVYDCVNSQFLGVNLYEDIPADGFIYTAAPSMERKHLTATTFSDMLF